MSEATLDYDQLVPGTGKEPVNWRLSSEEIAGMDEEQLRQTIIELNEKVRRLYEALMLEINRHKVGDPSLVKPEDIDHILNPEKID